MNTTQLDYSRLLQRAEYPINKEEESEIAIQNDIAYNLRVISDDQYNFVRTLLDLPITS